MTATSRATAGSVRSAHVAYFMPPDWGRIARHLAPALERAAGDAVAVRLLVLVPDPGAALSLTRALAALPAAAGRRLVAGTSAARLQRLLGTGAADAVIAHPEAVAGALAHSALKLADVATVAFAAADEMDAEGDALAAILAEVPREAARILTALAATPSVEMLIERYLARARRVTEDLAPAKKSKSAANVRFLTVHGNPTEVLPALLDEADAPSATVLAADDDLADDARALLSAIGYVNSPLATVTRDEVPANVSLVVTLGIPTATAWQAAVDATPSQIIAVIAPRDVEALRVLCGETEPLPVADRASVARARAAEARRRAELRAELAEGVPSREVLALEPLLHENDGLEIAAAALRLLEKERAAQSERVQAAEQRVRSQMREAQKEKEAAERPPRGPDFSLRGEGPRGFTKDRPPRPRREFGDKREGGEKREFRERPDGEKREFRERRPFGEKREYGEKRPFGDRRPGGDARGGGDKRSFGDKPRPFGEKRGFGDKPRGFGGRSDKPRGPRPPRGER